MDISRIQKFIKEQGQGVTGASLSDIELMIQQIDHELFCQESKIAELVCQRNAPITKAPDDLQAAVTAMAEIMIKNQEIKNTHEKSETAIQQAYLYSKKLDIAKKHLTTSIDALDHLTIIDSAVELVKKLVPLGKYKEAAKMLKEANQSYSRFEGHTKIKTLVDFNDMKELLKNALECHITTLEVVLATQESALQQLSDVYLVVDCLDQSFRKQLVEKFLNSERRIFEQNEPTSLDEICQRYRCICNWIGTNKKSKIFPSSWHVPYQFCTIICQMTKESLERILGNLKDTPDVDALLRASKSTLEFEDVLITNLGGGSQNDIERETFKFSACFEPYLTCYVEREQKKLKEKMEELVRDETWNIDDRCYDKALFSSQTLFASINQSLNCCRASSKSQTLLLNLFGVFQAILKEYASKLEDKLQNRDWTNFKAFMVNLMEKKDITDSVICNIINSAEYCRKTSGDLAKLVSSMIDPQRAPEANMLEVEVKFISLISDAQKKLADRQNRPGDLEVEDPSGVGLMFLLK